MPSLSPTMTEGNIARWLKKGDKVSPGEVLCEVETDKATVEMESMEEGYLTKIIHGDGAKEIRVGEIIAITVEEEEDIERFKDYKAPSSGASAAPAESKPQSESTEPKEEKELSGFLNQRLQRLKNLFIQRIKYSPVLSPENWQKTTMYRSQA